MQIMQYQAKRRNTMADVSISNPLPLYTIEYLISLVVFPQDDGDDDDDDDPVAKFIAKAFILVVGSITIYKCLAFLVLVAKAFYESASLAGWLK